MNVCVSITGQSQHVWQCRVRALFSITLEPTQTCGFEFFHQESATAAARTDEQTETFKTSNIFPPTGQVDWEKKHSPAHTLRWNKMFRYVILEVRTLWWSLWTNTIMLVAFNLTEGVLKHTWFPAIIVCGRFHAGTHSCRTGQKKSSFK